MYDLNFLAFAIDKKGSTYEDFLIPFTFFALLHNPNSHVEIIVKNSQAFKSKYSKEILELQKINKHFLIRNMQRKLNKHIPNTYRFFEVPTVKSKYTYITDIDIMYLDNLLPRYLNTCSQPQLPYHNVKRNSKSSRLSGVIMVDTDKYYTDAFKKCQDKHYKMNCSENDEVILGKMCQKIHGLPDNNFKYRPIFGIHFSPNRNKNSKVLPPKTSKLNTDRFLSIVKKYHTLFTYPIFERLVKNLKNFKVVPGGVKPISSDMDNATINAMLDKQYNSAWSGGRCHAGYPSLTGEPHYRDDINPHSGILHLHIIKIQSIGRGFLIRTNDKLKFN